MDDVDDLQTNDVSPGILLKFILMPTKRFSLTLNKPETAKISAANTEFRITDIDIDGMAE